MLRCTSRAWRTTAWTSGGNAQYLQWSFIIRRAYGDGGRNNAQSTSTSNLASDDTAASEHDQKWKDLKLRAYCVGTVTTPSPHSTPISLLLAELKDREGPRGRRRVYDRPGLLCLLFTPAYAQHALDAGLPLQAYEQISGLPFSTRQLHGLTAVVDRLPVSGADRDGREGLAYAYIRAVTEAEFSPAAGAPYQDSVSPSISETPKPGTLTFLTYPDSQQHTYSLQLPLAQTIFTTGHVSTLLHTIYKPDVERKLHVQSQELLDSQTLPLPFTRRVGNPEKKPVPDNKLSANSPLIPLTAARQVKDCMGNVVRTLSLFPTYGPDSQPNSNDTMPASQELEKAISTYFQQNNMDPEPVTVWALIIRDASQAFRQPSNSLEEEVNKNFRALLNHSTTFNSSQPQEVDSALTRLLTTGGARLCKVLSGGGGWAKKAGLLSLDPDVAYGSLAGAKEIDYAESELGRKAMRGDVVTEGDGMMFFLLPPELMRSDSEAANDRKEEPTGEDLEEIAAATTGKLRLEQDHAVFGTLPSSIDQALHAPAGSAESETSADPTTTSDIEHVPHLFGFLSEGGVALTVIDHSSGEPHVISQTKVDVPFSRVKVVQTETVLEQPEKPERMAGRKKERTKNEWYANGFVGSRRLELDLEGAEWAMEKTGVEAEILEPKEVKEAEEGRSFDEYSRKRQEVEGDARQVEGLFERFGDAGADEQQERVADPKKPSKPSGLPSKGSDGGNGE